MRWSIRHRWRALVLFDPPIYPRDGHPLRDAQQGDKDQLAVRARKRTERYPTPHDFARQLASRPVFSRWRPEAYELMARATLREEPATGEWILACPRELEARVFEENRDPSLWVKLGHVKAPVKLIGADPNIEGAEHSRAAQQGGRGGNAGRVRSDSRHDAFPANRAARGMCARDGNLPREARHGRLNLASRVRFLGFSAFDRLSWLLRTSMALLRILKYPEAR